MIKRLVDFFEHRGVSLDFALQQFGKKVLLITHRKCLDGYASQFVLQQMDEFVDLTVIEVPYGEQQTTILWNQLSAINPNLTVNKLIKSQDGKNERFAAVVVADMSIESPLMLEWLVNMGESLFLIDHHPNKHIGLEYEEDELTFNNTNVRLLHGSKNQAKEMIYNVVPNHRNIPITIHLSNEMSGAALLLKEVREHSGIGMEPLYENFIALISDYDTFQRKIPNVEAFIEILANEIFVNKVGMHAAALTADTLLHHTEGTYDTEHDRLWRQHGEREEVLSKHVNAVFALRKKVEYNGSLSRFPTILHVIVGKYELRSVYWNYLANTELKAYSNTKHMLVLIETEGEQVSLRSTQDEALGFASRYHGGGHPNAAGIPQPHFYKFLKEVCDIG